MNLNLVERLWSDFHESSQDVLHQGTTTWAKFDKLKNKNSELKRNFNCLNVNQTKIISTRKKSLKCSFCNSYLKLYKLVISLKLEKCSNLKTLIQTHTALVHYHLPMTSNMNSVKILGMWEDKENFMVRKVILW